MEIRSRNSRQSRTISNCIRRNRRFKFSSMKCFFFIFLVDSSQNILIQGDIAIDDVSITNGACEAEGSCNFDEGVLCGFYNVKEEDDFEWTLNRGTTTSSHTG